MHLSDSPSVGRLLSLAHTCERTSRRPERPRAPLKSGRSLGPQELKGTGPRTEPKKHVKNCCPLVAVARSGPGAPGVFPPGSWFGRLLCVFSFWATAQGPIISGLLPRASLSSSRMGGTSGPSMGTDPRTGIFRYPLMYDGLAFLLRRTHGGDLHRLVMTRRIRVSSCQVIRFTGSSTYHRTSEHSWTLSRTSNTLSPRLHDPGGETTVLRNNGPPDKAAAIRHRAVYLNLNRWLAQTISLVKFLVGTCSANRGLQVSSKSGQDWIRMSRVRVDSKATASNNMYSRGK